MSLGFSLCKREEAEEKEVQTKVGKVVEEYLHAYRCLNIRLQEEERDTSGRGERSGSIHTGNYNGKRWGWRQR